MAAHFSAFSDTTMVDHLAELNDWARNIENQVAELPGLIQRQLLDLSVQVDRELWQLLG